MSSGIEKNIGRRWEAGTPHHPKSIALGRRLGALDFENGDALCLKFGGDGDNGETLMYLLDIIFEQDEPTPTTERSGRET